MALLKAQDKSCFLLYGLVVSQVFAATQLFLIGLLQMFSRDVESLEIIAGVSCWKQIPLLGLLKQVHSSWLVETENQFERKNPLTFMIE